MRAIELKKILDTDFVVSYNDTYIQVESVVFHDCVRYDIESKKITSLLSPYSRESNYVENLGIRREIHLISKKLEELSSSGELDILISKNDIIKNAKPVWYEKNGIIIKSYCAHYGWPNTTHDGYMMYNESHFKTKREALDKAIGKINRQIKRLDSTIEEKINSLSEERRKRAIHKTNLNKFNKMKERDLDD